MMTEVPILNTTDLKNEIYRLKGLEREKSLALKQRFNGPGATFSTIISLFKGDGRSDHKDGGIFSHDIITTISRFLIPLTLNRTLFKNSNFIVKALVGLVSQKASGFISEDSVESVWDKAKGLLGKVTHIFDKKDVKKKPEVTSFKKIKKEEALPVIVKK